MINVIRQSNKDQRENKEMPPGTKDIASGKVPLTTYHLMNHNNTQEISLLLCCFVTKTTNKLTEELEQKIIKQFIKNTEI